MVLRPTRYKLVFLDKFLPATIFWLVLRALYCCVRSSWSHNSGHGDDAAVEEVEADDTVRLSAETREAVSAVKFIATHLKQEDDFAEVIRADFVLM